MSKEQQKQHLIDMMQKDEELGLYDEYLKDELKKYKDVKTIVFNKPKQEILLEDVFNDEKRQGVKELIDKHILEEAAEKYANQFIDGRDDYYGFIEGAKWQSERSYSEEEIFEIFDKWFCYRIDEDVEIKLPFSQWFKQFKKK